MKTTLRRWSWPLSVEGSELMRKPITIFSICLFVVAVFALWMAVEWRSVSNRRSGIRHEFGLSQRVGVLTEELALERAEMTLGLEGKSPAEWQPVADRRTFDPNGRPDHYLVRNMNNPNAGFITFENPAKKIFCVANVELDGTNFSCQISTGK
jgi:hypothetical protein